jgi:2-succinyl-6-hydroxy-2,4-cyclohexadiene-1-carboxylate synthase
VDLHVEIDGDGPPLVLLHGFTGSARAWDDILPHLAGLARVIRVDMIGHGQSPSPPDPARYSLDWAASDLLAVLDGLGLERVDLLGYSMGGRLALHFAVLNPRRLRRLILESASPGIEDDAERARRAASDDALADRIQHDGLAAFVAEWEQQPLLRPAVHVSEASRARQHALRLDNSTLGLANSLRGMGAGQQQPLWSRLGGLDLPVALVVGHDDTRYCAIGQRMQTTLSRAELTLVADAGHTVHLDQPPAFVKVVECSLSRN